MTAIRPFASQSIAALVVLGGLVITADRAAAQYIVVPGSGQKYAWDNFEDDKWDYDPRLPKSSKNLDKQIRQPLGVSTNGLWYESAKRGTPDYIKRVTPPKGGLPGSKGALMIRTLNSGVPGLTSYTAQQDDLLFNNHRGAISVSQSPSVVVRVYMPPFDQWEKNTGSTFGFRAGLTATVYEKKKRRGLFRINRKKKKTELFYPGMFIQFNSKQDAENKEDSAIFIIRRDSYGRDFFGPRITEPGWWTLGMSFTPDGRAHYFAKKGVEDLTMKDRIASSAYGGTRLEVFQTMFFNVLSKNDGRSWSTPWIIDDPAIHIGARR